MGVPRPGLLPGEAGHAVAADLGAEHVIELELEGAIEDEVLLRLPGIEQVRRIGSGLRLTVSDVAQVVPPLLSLLSDRGFEARRLATHHATLEDVFLSLTGRTLVD